MGFAICVARPLTPFCGLVALQRDELVFDILESLAGIGLEWIWRASASEQMHFLALDLWTAKLQSNAEIVGRFLSCCVSKKALPFRLSFRVA